MVPAAEYLKTVYRPDREYIDGVLLERNLGECDHARTQGLVGARLLAVERAASIFTLISPRVQIRPGRFRVPDVCAVRRDARVQQIIRTPSLDHTTNDGSREAKDGILRAGELIQVPLAELFD